MVSAPPGQPAAALAAAFSPDISRGPARQLARHELARSIYRPSAWQRIVNAVQRWLNSLFGSAGPGRSGWWTLIVLIIVAVLVVSAVIFWIGPAGRARRQRAAAVLTGEHLTAADHRRRAELHAQAGDYAAAIIDRVRAIAVELESRGVLTPRPGRTASELAAEAAAALPGSATALREAARLFEDVRYGGRAGTQAGYEQIRDLDARIQAARTPAVSAAGPGQAP
jgi:type II secretory pathway pseudopilin PulG